LQLRTIEKSISAGSFRSIIFGCLIISGTVILVRILWVFISAYGARAFSGRLRTGDRYLDWQQPALISWVGIRGGISLAAALALPISLGDGSPFPARNEILILTFAVILATLVLQGLSLAGLLRWLNFAAEGAESAEEQRARLAINGVALEYLGSVQKGDEIHRRAVEQLQETYRNRAERFNLTRQTSPDAPEAVYLLELISLERKLIGIQRTTLIELRDRGTISDAVLRRLEVLLDLEESQLEEQQR
jgi:monovalent cation/hydrogen antiporter